MAGLSKLAAVNLMLNNIGESPVSTLTGSSGDAFVATAIAVLDETNRAILSETWEFNRDVDYALTPDISGYINLTEDMLSVDASARSANMNVTQRGTKLYDQTNQTFVFTDVVYCDIDWELAYEDVPQYIRQYVAVRAARVFAHRTLGDVTGEQLTAKDELEARIAAKRKDLKNGDRNIFRTGHGIGRIKQRRI